MQSEREQTLVYLFWHYRLVAYTFCQASGTSTKSSIIEHYISDRRTLYLMKKQVFCILNVSSQMDIKRKWDSNSGEFMQIPETYFLLVIYLECANVIGIFF